MSDKLPPEEREEKKLPPEDEHYVSEEKQKEILQKYDPESNTRDLSGTMKHVVFYGLLAFSLFQLYTAIFGQYTAYIQRSIHLGFALSLIFLLFPARKRHGARRKVAIYDYVLALLAIGVGLYWPIMYDDLVFRLGRVTEMDLIVGILAVVLTLEATRRAVGLPITIIASIFLTYTFFGPYFPGFLRHRGQVRTLAASA